MARLRGVVVGAGYFSRFHYDAWLRIPEVEIVALCDLDHDRMCAASQRYGIEFACLDYREALREHQPDFVDIVTPPATHLEICRWAAEHGIHIICQKPLAPSWDQADEIVRLTRHAGVSPAIRKPSSSNTDCRPSL